MNFSGWLDTYLTPAWAAKLKIISILSYGFKKVEIIDDDININLDDNLDDIIDNKYNVRNSACLCFRL